MIKITQNPKYRKYKFNYNWIEKISDTIGNLYYCILDKNPIEIDKKYLFDQSIEILTVSSELCIAMDKTLSDNNLIAFASIASTCNEYLMKYALISKDEKKRDDFNHWNDVPIRNLYTKLNDSISNKILRKDFSGDMFNDPKHLNNIKILEFHTAAAENRNTLMNGTGWIDNDAYHFGVLESLDKTLDAVLISCYFNSPWMFIDPIFIEKYQENPLQPKDNRYPIAPWFIRYIEQSRNFKNRELFFKDNLSFPLQTIK